MLQTGHQGALFPRIMRPSFIEVRSLRIAGVRARNKTNSSDNHLYSHRKFSMETHVYHLSKQPPAKLDGWASALHEPFETATRRSRDCSDFVKAAVRKPYPTATFLTFDRFHGENFPLAEAPANRGKHSSVLKASSLQRLSSFR